MKKPEIAFVVVILVTIVALLVHEYFVSGVPLPRLMFPLIAGTMVVGLGLIRIAHLVLSPVGHNESASPAAGSPYAAIASCLAIFPLIWAGGFFAGTAIYIVGTMKMGGASMRLSVVAAVVMTAVLYVLFIKVFQVLLPVAPLWM